MNERRTGTEIVAAIAGGKPWWKLQAGDLLPWFSSLPPAAMEGDSGTRYIGSPWDGASAIELDWSVLQGRKVARVLEGVRALFGEFADEGILLKSSPPIWQHELTATSAPWFHAAVPLAGYLAGMATGHPQHGREADRGGKDDWSFTVDELLRVTAALPISKSDSIGRGNPYLVGFVADTSSLPPTPVGAGVGGGDGDDDPEDRVAEWPQGPISTVHVTVGPIDDRRDD